MRSSHSPTIRSRYDYYYSSMSPASSAANFYDNQNQSLFGDPVPPSTDFLETLDNHLYGSFRRGSNITLPSNERPNNDAFIDDFMHAQNSGHKLRMSAKHRQKDRSAPCGDSSTTFRDEFRFDNNNKRRSSSSYSDEFRANLEPYGSESEILVPTAPKRLFSEEPINYRNIITMQSNDSQNGSDWIRPNFVDANWKGFQPRPASRNVMHIDHGSAMTAIIPESSSTPSSDDNKSSIRGGVKQIQVLPYADNHSRPATVIGTRPNTNDSSSEDYLSSASPPKRDVSPAIITNTINTGSEFRFQPSRLHKKTSFTIINELEPNQSRPASPSGGRVSPFRGKGFRVESSKRFSRPTSCPESPRNAMEMDTISSSHDDSQIHSKPSVHFNIIPPIPRKRTAIRVIEAPRIADENEMCDVSYNDRDMESFEMLSSGQIRSGNSSRRGSLRGPKPSPAPRHHIQRSADDLMFTQPIVNPRSYHKGLLGIVSGGGTVQPSRIPRRKSSVSTPNISRNSSISMTRRNSRVSSSSDRLNNRRDSSSSPRRRRPSNELGGSMIDLGMTPSSSFLTPSRSIQRISKPTTLSPIVGTPNKDCEDDSSHCGNDGMNRIYSGGIDSPTKIPIRRRSSSINVNGSRSSSKTNSREPSPMKKSPTKIPQKINQKTSSPSKGAKIDKTTNTKSVSNAVHKETSSTKKEPAINREKSSVKKAPPATIKREPSTLKRQPSNLKRENSQQKLKRENSTIGLTGSSATATASTSSKPPLASNMRPPQSTLAKNQSDSSLAKRLEKKNSFKQKRRTSSESDGLNEIDTANLSDKLKPLTTKTNGISMTTAAVTSQPVQITTAVTDHLSKKNSSGQIVNNDNSNVNSDNNNNNISISHVSSDQKGETMATTTTGDMATAATGDATSMNTDAASAKGDTNGKSDAVSEMKQVSDKIALDANGNGSAKMENPAAVLEKKSSTRTLGGKSEAGSSMLGTPIVPESIERELIGTPIETKVNIIDNTLISGGGGIDSQALLMKSDDIIEMQEYKSATGDMSSEHRLGDNLEKDNGITSHMSPSIGAKNETSENGDAESDEPTTCCKLCKCCTPCYASALCLPCRRLRKLSCCSRRTKSIADEQKAAEIATSILHENETKATETAADAVATADSCWKRLKCCNRKSKQTQKKIMDEVITMEEESMRKVSNTAAAAVDVATKERGKCALCLAKVFCCRKTNKVQTSIDGNMSGNESDDEARCCSCLPCRRKKKEPMAWSERRQDSLTSTENMPKKSCCAVLCEKLMCCKKKPAIESRRTSMNSKKQSIAPTLPPEDTRPKLDESLVDHTSLMKAAIPVLPVGLAWFCLICNCLIPGSGTLFSGIFCLCLGIPRFSQHDGARARIGSFFVNCIVGIAQAFTLIFCLVGWGWSIWWGMIMLRTARKHRKLVQAQETDLEEAHTIASHSTTNQATQNQRDIEAGRKRN